MLGSPLFDKCLNFKYTLRTNILNLFYLMSFCELWKKKKVTAWQVFKIKQNLNFTDYLNFMCSGCSYVATITVKSCFVVVFGHNILCFS